MELRIDKQFKKDTSKVKEAKTLAKLGLLLREWQSIERIQEIVNLKRIVGKKSYYRVRLGDYRIGIRLEGETLHIIRFLHRKDIYKYFPDVWF